MIFIREEVKCLSFNQTVARRVHCTTEKNVCKYSWLMQGELAYLLKSDGYCKIFSLLVKVGNVTYAKNRKFFYCMINLSSLLCYGQGLPTRLPAVHVVD